MTIGQYCQRQRCKHVESEQFWHAFASRGFVSDSWAFLFYSCHSATTHLLWCRWQRTLWILQNYRLQIKEDDGKASVPAHDMISKTYALKFVEQLSWVKLSFVIFDIQALWRSGLSVRVSKITNDGLNNCPDNHYNRYQWAGPDQVHTALWQGSQECQRPFVGEIQRQHLLSLQVRQWDCDVSCLV